MKITSTVRPSQLLHSERVYQETYMCEVGENSWTRIYFYGLITHVWSKCLLISVDNLRLKFSLNVTFNNFKA